MFCLLLAIISGLFHILGMYTIKRFEIIYEKFIDFFLSKGCKGKRPSGEKRQLIN